MTERGAREKYAHYGSFTGYSEPTKINLKKFEKENHNIL